MNRYQLAKLVEWAGHLKTRKRLQKVVYLLQAGGCQLEMEYTLHHYGPYSQDVKRLTDQMVQAGLLDEQEPSGHSLGYEYSLTDKSRTQVRKLDAEERGGVLRGSLEGFEIKAKELLRKEVSELELAATVAYFKKQGESWDEAREAAAKFKNRLPEKVCEKRGLSRW